jgi:integrase
VRVPSRILNPASRRSTLGGGLPRIRVHDLRHSHATLLLASGANAKTVSSRLGHSSVGFTLDIYASAIPQLEEQAAQVVADLVFGAE